MPLLHRAGPLSVGTPALISLPVGGVAQLAAQRKESVEQAVRAHRINWLLQALETP